MTLLIKSCIREMEGVPLDEGDVILHNDPYRGGLHTPEHTFFTPFFVDGAFMGYAVAIGHVAEVGGMVPGGFASEGDGDLPRGPARAPGQDQEAGQGRGRGVEAPARERPHPPLQLRRLPRHDQRLRARRRAHGRAHQEVRASRSSGRRSPTSWTIPSPGCGPRSRAIPDGTYSFEDYMEDDGIDATPYRIAVDMVVQGDEIVADFGRSDAQAKGAINATLGVTCSATYNAMLHLTDPSIPRNAGCYRPIRVLARPATVVNVDFPAPEVGGNTETPRPHLLHRDRGDVPLPAGTRVRHRRRHPRQLPLRWPRSRERRVSTSATTSWSPAGAGAPSPTATTPATCINGNCRTVPVEVYESRYPWIVETLSLTEDSGGAGKYRGGLGSTKTLECTADEIIISYMADRHRNAPWGLLRAAVPGARPRCSSRKRTRTSGRTSARATTRSRPASSATSRSAAATACASCQAVAVAMAR